MFAMAITATYFTDPGCPWAYSANPALAVLRWRYGAQLDWRIVTIGLAEDPARYVARGYTPVMMARGYLGFRRFGMPFATQPRPRVVATALACRAIVATRLADPQREWAVLRALQFAWFTTPALLDELDVLGGVLEGVGGLDAAAIVAALHDPAVTEAYQADRALARTAAGSPTEMQGKAATTDGPVRYTAPSVLFASGERTLEAGGFQPVEAYDVVIANLDPALERRPAADDPLEALEALGFAATTAEIAAVMTADNDAPDPCSTEEALVALVGEGAVVRTGLGDGALWAQATAVALPAAA